MNFLSTRWCTLFTLVLALTATSAAARNPEAGRCSEEGERTLSDCNSGEKCVWHYTKTEPTGQVLGSWCYKTREAAQRARENSQKLCETVSQYFDDTSCPTTYGAPYCRACGSTSDRKGCDAAASEGLDASEILFEVNRGAQDFSTRLPIWERAFPGSTTQPNGGPYTAVGTVLSGYADSMKHAMRQAKKLSCIVDRAAHRQTDEIANEVRRTFREFESAVNTMRDKASKLPQQKTGVGFGNVSTTGWEINSQKEGTWTGTDGGTGTRIEEQYYHGQRHGLTKLFHTDGSRKEFPYSWGKIEGLVRSYAPNGVKTEEVEYVSGKQTWNATLWDKGGSGRKVLTRVSRGQSRFEEFYYWPDGSVRARMTTVVVYENGRQGWFKDGEAMGYYEYGGPQRWRIVYEARPAQGKSLVHECRYYNRNGTVRVNRCPKMPLSEINEDFRID